MNKHHANCRCSLCNRVRYDTFSFRSGYVCEECLEFLKNEFSEDQFK